MPLIRLSDIELHYVEQGTGRPLLLVHGFPLDHTMWKEQIAELSGQYRVIVPDLRGFGRSGVSPGTVTMEQFADDLANLLDALAITERVVLGGLSMGGYIAFQFWKRHADRLAGLVLCDTRAAVDNAETARGRLASAEQVESQGAAALVTTMLGRLFCEETVRDRPAIVAETRQTMLGTAPHGIAAALRGMAARPDMTTALAQIVLPTLVLCGESDVISPPQEMLALAGALPTARFAQIVRAGHMAPLEQPAAVNAELRTFLAAVGN